MALSAIREFLRHEAAGGVVLLAAAALAFILTNSPLADHYLRFFELHLSLKLGDLGLDKSLGHWINDGLMAIFFFLVGLEIKRELIEGELSSPRQAALPAIAAIGGMAAPALVYVLFNAGTPETLRGWAIPAATDIAFAMGVVSLLGNRVPGEPEDLSARARDHRRPRRHRRHRDLLHRRPVAAGARPRLGRHRDPHRHEPPRRAAPRRLCAGRHLCLGLRAGIGRARDAGRHHRRAVRAAALAERRGTLARQALHPRFASLGRLRDHAGLRLRQCRRVADRACRGRRSPPRSRWAWRWACSSASRWA